MIIGSCLVEIMIYESNSLKEKRQVVRSIIEKLKSRFNISIAEVGLNDKWRHGLIGFSCVSNETVHVNKTISNVLGFIERDSRLEIINTEIEIL